VSLVTQTFMLLKRDILAGVWPEYLPSEHDLCARLCVSRVTLRSSISKLHDEGLVRSTRGKRRQVCKIRHCRLPASSRQVILTTPLPPSLLPPSTLFWIDTLREYLAKKNHVLSIKRINGHRRRTLHHSLHALQQQLKPVAWVLFEATEPVQQWFSERNLPCLVTGARYAGVKLPAVAIAYRAICRHAVGQLLARGHKRLAFMCSTAGLSAETEGESGFLETISNSARAGIHARVVRHDGSACGIANKIKELFSLPEPPTGLIVTRAASALTTASCLLYHGLRLPYDVALISINDTPTLEDFVPAITRYKLCPQTIARKIITIMSKMLNGEIANPVVSYLLPSFFPGQTIACPRKHT